MRFKTTLILFVIFVAILAFVLLFESKTSQEENPDKLFAFSNEEVEKIVIDGQEDRLVFLKNEDEGWSVSEPIEAYGDRFEIDSLINDISSLEFERIAEENPADLEKYGIPKKQFSFYLKDKSEPEKILIGSEHPLDKTFFAQKATESRVGVVPSSFKSRLEKTLMDYRKKNVFEFNTEGVKKIEANIPGRDWTSVKRGEEWFLEEPVFSLADKNHFRDLLSSLSNLQAQEFLSEDKSEKALEEWGLQDPEFLITLHLPEAGAETTFSLQEKEGNVYVTSSSSTKIIRVEKNILDVLNTQIKNLRERKAAIFYSWEVDRFRIQKEEYDLTLAKDDEGNWRLEGQKDETVDRMIADRFLRFFEATEATKIIDPPLNLKDFGLDPPQGQAVFWIEDSEDQTKEVTILIGKREEEVGQVYVKNKRFDYLFKISSSFLDELPEDTGGWMAETDTEEE